MNHGQIEKSRLVPAGAMTVKSKKSPTVVYLYELNGRLFAKGFYGKQTKPGLHYYYKSAESRAQSVTKYMNDRDEVFAYKANKAAEKKAKLSAPQTALKVGDVLMCSWGYDQTNIDYYEVIELVGKRSVIIQEIGCESVATEFMQGRSVPIKGNYIGKQMKKLVNEFGGVKITSYANAYKMEPIAKIAGKDIYSSSSWTAYA